jgi:hypothetical protein
VPEVAPWAGALGETVAETVGPIRFVVKLFEKLTKIDDPNELGYLACKTAYQQALQQALNELGIAAKVKLTGNSSSLRALAAPAGYDLKGSSTPLRPSIRSSRTPRRSSKPSPARLVFRVRCQAIAPRALAE